MSDLNRVTFTGRCTRDAELRYLTSGTAVTDVGFAINKVFKKEGEFKEETTFVDVTLWGKFAETLSAKLTKGTFCSVDGRLRMESWESKEGAKRSKLSIVADNIGLHSNNSNKTKEQNVEFATA
jgi:single-strand DNA-binding protein